MLSLWSSRTGHGLHSALYVKHIHTWKCKILPLALSTRNQPSVQRRDENKDCLFTSRQPEAECFIAIRSFQERDGKSKVKLTWLEGIRMWTGVERDQSVIRFCDAQTCLYFIFLNFFNMTASETFQRITTIPGNFFWNYFATDPDHYGVSSSVTVSFLCFLFH